MPANKLDQFGGELPGWSPKLLPGGQSTRSVNAYLFEGELQGWRLPKLLHNLVNPNAAYAYRIPSTVTSGSGVQTFVSGITGPSTWLEFNDPDTNVVRSQVVNDQFQRYYAASPSQVVLRPTTPSPGSNQLRRSSNLASRPPLLLLSLVFLAAVLLRR